VVIPFAKKNVSTLGNQAEPASRGNGMSDGVGNRLETLCVYRFARSFEALVGKRAKVRNASPGGG